MHLFLYNAFFCVGQSNPKIKLTAQGDNDCLPKVDAHLCHVYSHAHPPLPSPKQYKALVFHMRNTYHIHIIPHHGTQTQDFPWHDYYSIAHRVLWSMISTLETPLLYENNAHGPMCLHTAPAQTHTHKPNPSHGTCWKDLKSKRRYLGPCSLVRDVGHTRDRTRPAHARLLRNLKKSDALSSWQITRYILRHNSNIKSCFCWHNIALSESYLMPCHVTVKVSQVPIFASFVSVTAEEQIMLNTSVLG